MAEQHELSSIESIIIPEPERSHQGDFEIGQKNTSLEIMIEEGENLAVNRIVNIARAKSRVWFENIYRQAPTDSEVGYLMANLLKSMNVLAVDGESEELDPEQQSIVDKTFVKELLNFIQERASSGEDPEKLKTFLGNIYEIVFSYSPNVLDSLEATEMLQASLDVLKIKGAREFFTDKFLLATAEKFNDWTNKTKEEILKLLQTRPIAESIALVDQLFIVGRVANRNGMPKSASNIRHLLGDSPKEKYPPLLAYAAELSAERISMRVILRSSLVTMEYPRKEIIQLLENAPDETEQTSVRLSKQINPDIGMPHGSKLAPVAADAVAIIDRQNIALAVAKIDFEKLPKPQELSLAGIRNARKIIAGLKGGLGFSDIFGYLSKLGILKYIPRESVSSGYEELDKALADLEETVSQQLPSVHFENYSQIPNDRELNPFPGSRDEQLPQLLEYLHRPELRKKIGGNLNVDLTKISLRTQIHLLRFLSDQDKTGFERVSAVLKARPDQANNILNSFLACSENLEYGGAILNIAEKADTELSTKVFEKYNEIVNLGEEVRNNLGEYFGSQSGIIDVSLLVKNLLQKANRLLADYSNRLNEPAEQANQQELVQALSQVQSEVLVFASGVKAAVKGEKVEWRSIPGVNEQEKDSSALTTAEKGIMLQIFKANREKTYPPTLFTGTVRDFEETLRNGGHTFRLLYYNGSLLAFFHYDEKSEDKEIYVGSLNLNPNATDTPVAVAMIKDALIEKPDYKLKAVVWGKNPARLFYTKFLGFKKVGEIADYDGTGEQYWELARPAKE